MTKDEALQMCLEYIETNAHERRCVRWAIKDALAQPVQKPFTYYNPVRDAIRPFPVDGDIALYTATPLPVQPERQWVGLTHKEMYDVIRPLCSADEMATWLLEISEDEYLAIETKLKEKNT